MEHILIEGRYELIKTSDAQKVTLYKIASEMKLSGLPDKFIADAVEIGKYYEGVYDLFELWANEDDPEFKEQIVANIQAEIDEFSEQPKRPTKKFSRQIKFQTH